MSEPQLKRNRPRIVTELLKRAGEREIIGLDGVRKSRAAALADNVWELLTTGKLAFPGGHDIKVSARDWKDAAQWLYHHIDGPAAVEDRSSGGLDRRLETATTEDLQRLIEAASAGTGTADVTAGDEPGDDELEVVEEE